jgi:hypothetical protein
VNKQPEALRLADLLTAIAEDPMWAAHGEISKSAALRIADELRRQHAGIKRLHGLLEKAREEIPSDWGNCHYLCWLMYEIEDALQEVKP